VTRLEGFGLAVDLPAGWEGEIYRRASAGDGLRPQGAAEAPVLHAATFALPAERGDFGNGAVDLMRRDDVFVSLFEYDAPAASTPLFEAVGVPRLGDADFDPATLQRAFPGHSGCQRFFRVGDRAFCLYVVVGSHLFRHGLVRQANAVLATLRLG
jgi:hypothetical protein